MAKDIKFNIRLTVDGKQQLVTVATDAEKLRNQLENAQNDATRLRRSLLEFSNITTIFNSLSSSIQQINSVTRGLVQAYSVQEQNERRLAEVMRERMGASDETIQSMYKLASAQQELGVIGDEVQLAGMQQVATFLHQSSSIATLLPAMNNLIAQQKGLAATEQDAQTIGNLMGKAMQGDVTALRRVGISFSAAQAEVMKYGTESQRAATLAQIITDNVGNMNAELAKTDAGKLKQHANALGDMAEAVGKVLMPYQSLLHTLGTVGMAAMGMGSIISSVRGVFVALVAVTKASTYTMIEHKVATWADAAATKMNALARTMLGNTTLFATASTRALTAATAALYAVLSAGVIIAIMAVVSAIKQWTAKTEALTRAEEEEKQTAEEAKSVHEQAVRAYEDARSQLQQNIIKLREFKGNKEQERRIVEEMNNTYGRTMGYYSTVADWYKTLTSNSKIYCQQLINEVKIHELAAKAAALDRNIRSITTDENGRTRMYSNKRRIVYTQGGTAGGTIVAGSEPSDLDKAQAAVNKFSRERRAALKEMESLASKNATLGQKLFTGSTTEPGFNSTTNVTPTVRTSPKATKPEPVESVPLMNIQETQTSSSASNAIIGKISTNPLDLMQHQVDRVKAIHEQAQGFLDLRDAGVLSAEAVSKAIEELNKELDALGAKKIDVGIEDGKTKKEGKALSEVAKSVNEIGNALSSVGSSLKMPELNVAGIIAQVVANLALSMSQALTKTPKGFFGWLAMGATGVAQLLSMTAAIKGATKYAEGGIAYGPTLGVFGEYPGASHNPEVVAPLNKLRSMIQPAGAGGVVEMRIRGTELVGVLHNQRGVSSRSRKLLS